MMKCLIMRVNIRKRVPYSKAELERGTRHEMEHTKNKEAAKKIAEDHLREYPTYYRRLAEAERVMRRDKRRKLRNAARREIEARRSPFSMGLFDGVN